MITELSDLFVRTFRSKSDTPLELPLSFQLFFLDFLNDFVVWPMIFCMIASNLAK